MIELAAKITAAPLAAFVLLTACSTRTADGTTVAADDDGELSRVWVADLGDGTYVNPVIHADYSDPDVVAADDGFYMTASSFNCMPGLPILHSHDLVNWRIVGHALSALPPAGRPDSPQHGKGVWAPSIRLRDGRFYIYWGDPDYGIYMVCTDNPRGKWSEPHLVKAGKGMIDTCPLWDDDGRAYLVHGWAGSRAGFNSVLTMWEMTPDGRELIGNPVLVFDGNDSGKGGLNQTVEGPKLYKRNGFYYILAPAGGVATGWQLAMRSRSPFGPYEARTVMAQGRSDVNGPHQGGLVDTPCGESWFLHFQDKGLYGRVVHLNPVEWRDGWPVIGSDPDGDGCGEPVAHYRKPDVGRTYPRCTPQESDSFDSPQLGLQWQWQADYRPTFGMAAADGYMRIYGYGLSDELANFWEVPNLLLQKFPAPSFAATACVKVSAKADGSQSGLIVMGNDYARLAVEKRGGRFVLRLCTCRNAEKGTTEEVADVTTLEPSECYGEGSYRTYGCRIYLRVTVAEGGECKFAYSLDGENFQQIDSVSFKAAAGKWTGAKVGLYSVQPSGRDRGWLDVCDFRMDGCNRCD